MCDEFNVYDEKLAYLIIILSGLLDFNKGNFDINNLSNIISSVSYFSGLITASSLLNLYIKTFPSNEENEPVIEEIEKEKQVIEEKENTKETKEKSKELSIQEQIELCNEYKKQLLNTGNELEEEKTYTKKY